MDKWKRLGYGSIIGADRIANNMTHVMFADDTTLIASSKRQLEAHWNRTCFVRQERDCLSGPKSCPEIRPYQGSHLEGLLHVLTEM